MAVERYLLGELTGETKDAFEEHYFECPECASHLKDGARLVDALPAVLPNIGNSENSEKDRRVAVFPSSRWLRILTPALAASLLVIGYQSAVLVPGLKRQIAALDTPQLAENLVLANGSARGAASDAVVTRASGALMLSIDIPGGPSYTEYLCSLHGPSGALLWTGHVSPRQAKDTVLLYVPQPQVRSGDYQLVVTGVSSASSGAPVALATYPFHIAPGQ
jgi:hypothetical protein